MLPTLSARRFVLPLTTLLMACNPASTPGGGSLVPDGATADGATDAAASDLGAPWDLAADVETTPHDAATPDLGDPDGAPADLATPDALVRDSGAPDPGDAAADDTGPSPDVGDIGAASDGSGPDVAGWDAAGADVAWTDLSPADGGVADLGAADGGLEDAGADDQGPPDAGSPWPGYPWEPAQGLCGVAPYRWLPPDEVGAVLTWEESLGFRLSREMIAALLAGAGYPDVVEPLHGTRVWTIRYTTQDQGELREATGLVAIPDLVAEPGELVELPTLLAMHPTVGYDDRCAPSAGLEGPAAALIPASQGYIGVAPDLLGLCGFGDPCPDAFHPYLIGEPTALAAWDAVRAGHVALAEIAAETGVVPNAVVLPWGPSQGGHGSLFADRYAEHYAPEFEVPCAAAVVPPADLAGAAANALDHLSGATQLGTAFLAAAALWYAPPEPLSTLFNADGPRDYAAHIPETFPTCCRARNLLTDATTIEDVYTADALAAAQAGQWDDLAPWGCMVLENSLPTSSVPRHVDHPVLMVLGERDEMVWPPAQREAVRTLCEQGYRIDMVECAGVNHANAALHSVQLQLEWMRACLAGEALDPDRLCRIDPPVECR